MKTLFILSMAGMLLVSGGCNRSDDTQDIQREEEMNRGDMIEDSTYDQDDVSSGSAGPSNVESGHTDDLEDAAPDLELKNE